MEIKWDKDMRSVFLLLIFSLLIYGCSSTPNSKMGSFQYIDPGKTLEFKRLNNMVHVSQTQSSWCWGATLASVVNITKGKSLKACDIVSSAFGMNCCANKSACNRENSLYVFDDILEPYDLNAYVINNQISWDKLTDELRHERPILIRVESQMGQGHFINLVGFDVRRMANGSIKRSIIVSDPMYGYYRGNRNDIGYSVSWENLKRGNLDRGYTAYWTHTVLFRR